MPIAVFDIDGTLTDTMDVDVQCFEGAIREVLGIDVPSSWPEMDEVTDPAILRTACEMRGRPTPDAETEARIAARVGELLTVELRERPERFAPIPGARDVFAALTEAGWRVAMATGAWRPSAVVKLAGAAIPFDGVPLATSSDRVSRRDIIEHAVARLGGARGEPVVYVGDGVWDGRAATSLGYGFVGVGAAEKADALRDVGAREVLPDLRAPALPNLLRDAARTG